LNEVDLKTADSFRWVVSPGVRSTCVEDGAVLLDIKNGRCYSLNPVAARVWVAIEGSPEGISLADIVDILEMHFEVPRPEMERDTADCLKKLQRKSLVQRQPHSTSTDSAPGKD
jgi:Coenzyme PQQ synthesis protein D (PqqD)